MILKSEKMKNISDDLVEISKGTFHLKIQGGIVERMWHPYLRFQNYLGAHATTFNLPPPHILISKLKKKIMALNWGGGGIMPLTPEHWFLWNLYPQIPYYSPLHPAPIQIFKWNSLKHLQWRMIAFKLGQYCSTIYKSCHTDKFQASQATPGGIKLKHVHRWIQLFSMIQTYTIQTIKNMASHESLLVLTTYTQICVLYHIQPIIGNTNTC